MPRKGPAEVREVEPDPILGSKLVTRFISKLIRGGKRSVAEGIFYGALQTIHERTGRNPLDTLEQALRNVMPMVEVRGRRVGGQTYQVPVEVTERRKITLGIRWLIRYARERTTEKTMRQRLAAELLDAAGNGGNAVRRKEETHKMAESNRAFAHYRW